MKPFLGPLDDDGRVPAHQGREVSFHFLCIRTCCGMRAATRTNQNGRANTGHHRHSNTETLRRLLQRQR